MLDVLIVGPRPISLSEAHAATCATWGYIVAVDGGADRCAELGILPSVVIGDMDSIGSGTDAAGVAALEQHPTDKDYSDLDAAVRHVNGIDAQRVTAIGLSGGRIDHLITVASSIAGLSARTVRWIGPGEVTEYIGPGQAVNIAPRTTFSVVPLLGAARVTISGARWNLEDVTVPALSTVGLSNEATDLEARVTVNSGGRTMVVTQLQR